MFRLTPFLRLLIHSRVCRQLLTAVACSAALTSPASATFHLAHIERVMTGLNGTTDIQYVEIVMETTSQNQITGSKLVAFNADGSFAHVVLVIPSTVQSGSQRSWIMATAGFEPESGIAPDFVFDSSDSKGLIPEDGMVCWGKPSDPANPNQMVDCVSYGNYTGPDNFFTSGPSAITPFGHGLLRIADVGNSNEDFICEDPAKPRNNDNEIGSVDASTPCTAPECGDGSVADPEDCDDGDTSFTVGDFCSAECTAVPCGIPTKPDGVTPKTADALFVLRTAVLLATCDKRVCDVNNSNSVTTGDALLVLRKAVGLAVTLTCPT